MSQEKRIKTFDNRQLTRESSSWPLSCLPFRTVSRMSKTELCGKPALRAAVDACRPHFVLAALFSALLNILFLAPTLYMLQVYDRVVPTRGLGTLLFLTLIFVFATATLSGLDFIRARLLTRASLRLDRLLSGQVISALLARADRTQSSQVLREFDVLRSALTGVGALALFDAPWTPIYILICFLIHPLLGALALVGSVVLLSITALNEHATKQPTLRATEANARGYLSLDQSVTLNGVVRALGMRRALTFRHLQQREIASELIFKANLKGSTYYTLTKFTRLTLQSVALGVGAYLAIEQKISPGAIFAASLLVTRALGPIEQILGAWKSIVQAQGAWRSLQALLAASDGHRPRTLLTSPTSRLEVERLSVFTQRQDRLLVNEVSFALQPGDVLGVIGPSGAGKSTLVRAIAGATTLLRGSIRFDGADATDWDESQLASHVGYAPQEPSLFQGTVKDNITRFRTASQDLPDIDAQAVEAARECGAHDFILRLPEAYETELGPGGAGLSAGQAQRISLARALFGAPKVVIMDEPNAHLDAAGEQELVGTILRLKGRGATVIVVAHRTGVLSVVDKLLVVRDGRVEAFGPRDEVVRKMAMPNPSVRGLDPRATEVAN